MHGVATIAVPGNGCCVGIHSGITSDISVPNKDTTSSATVRLCSNGDSGTRRFAFAERSSKDCRVIGIGSKGTLSIHGNITRGGTVIRRCSQGGSRTRQ